MWPQLCLCDTEQVDASTGSFTYGWMFGSQRSVSCGALRAHVCRCVYFCVLFCLLCDEVVPCSVFVFVCMFVCSSICMYVHQCCCSYVVYMCSMIRDCESAEGHEHISNFASYTQKCSAYWQYAKFGSVFFCTAVAICIAMHSSSMLGWGVSSGQTIIFLSLTNCCLIN